MTERLYYRNPELLEFEATITGRGRHEGKWYTVTDRSAFYPTSGGQLHDTGTLGGVEVEDVIETEEGDVWHITSQSVGAIGGPVRGIIDARRRLDNRQKHTAQHILSHASNHLYGYETVSVHLGEEYGAVELKTSVFREEEMAAIEARANDVVQACYPVETLFVDANDAESLPLRRPASREGTLRIIKVGDLDYSACGGTHCTNTGQVALVKILSVEKMRGHALLKFLAGRQALADYVLKHAVAGSVAEQLTCHVGDLPDRVARLTHENRGQRQTIADLQRQLIPVWAEELSVRVEAVGDVSLVWERRDALDMRTAGSLAGQVAARTGAVVGLVVGDRLVLASPPDSVVHCGNLARKLCDLGGLRGGGGPNQAQVAGIDQGDTGRYKELLKQALKDG